jgi:hypothetical protein
MLRSFIEPVSVSLMKARDWMRPWTCRSPRKKTWALEISGGRRDEEAVAADVRPRGERQVGLEGVDRDVSARLLRVDRHAVLERAGAGGDGDGVVPPQKLDLLPVVHLGVDGRNGQHESQDREQEMPTLHRVSLQRVSLLLVAPRPSAGRSARR